MYGAAANANPEAERKAKAAGGRRLRNRRGPREAVRAAKNQMLKQRVSEAHKNSCCWFLHRLSPTILNG